MLAVLFMLIVRAGDPNMWRWLVSDGGKHRPASPRCPPDNQPNNVQETRKGEQSGRKRPKRANRLAAPLPPATGPTDEDPDQAEAAREEFQVLTNGRLTLGREEMVPYYRLVEWVKNQPLARLDRRAHHELWYTHLHDSAGKHRGELVALDVDVQHTMGARGEPLRHRLARSLGGYRGVAGAITTI